MAAAVVAAAARRSCQTTSKTPLCIEFYDFCRKGDVSQVQSYLSEGLPADWTNERDRNRSLLMATAWKDSEDVCRLLIEQKAPLDHQDSSGLSAMHICAKQNSIRVAKLLLQAGANVNLLAENDITALMICADLGHTELAEVLLKQPTINLDQQSSRGFTALMKSVFENSVQLAHLLIDRGAKLDLASNSGFTALHLCAQLDRREIAQRILAKAPPEMVNQPTKPEFKGNTALILASLNGHAKMVQLLHENGADPNFANSEGCTALDQVSGSDSKELLKLLQSWSSQSRNKPTAPAGLSLADAIRKDDLESVRKLAKSETVTNVDRTTGRTPLMLAAGLGKTESLKVVLSLIGSSSSLDFQVNRRAEDSTKATALHAAIQCGSESCVKLLLQAGASLAVLDAQGSTPLSLCADLGSATDVAELIIERASADELMTPGADGRLCPAKLAAVRGHLDVLRLMLNRLRKLDDNLSRETWLPQILEEAKAARQFEAANAVLEEMPKNAKNNEELTTARLFKAAMDANPEKVKELLDSSQAVRDSINKRSQQDPGWTALMASAWNDDESTCKLLLDRGADPNVTEQKLGITALHIAVQQNSRRVVKVLLDQKSIGLNARSKDNRTPLIRAAWLNHMDIAKLLLDRHASVNDQEIDGFSALHFCAQENLLELAKLLISHDADLELQTSPKKNCNTAFTLAAVKGHTDMLELLANVGADIYYKSSQGNAMDLAKRAKRTAAIEMLVKLDRKRKCSWEAATAPIPSSSATSNETAGVKMQLDAGSAQLAEVPSAEMDSSNLNSSVVPPIRGYQYSMRSNPRGMCVIINNEQFSGECEPRPGSRKDVASLERLFKDTLKFRVQVHQNLDACDILALMRSLAARDRHTKFDCFVAFIMSHGECDRVLGCDGEWVALDDIFAPFYCCDSLQQKPKLFFLQACRPLGVGASVTAESNVDQPVSSVGSNNSSPSNFDASNRRLNRQLSEKLDFLFAYSVTRGDYALRCPTTGSIYIQNLCEVFRENYKTHHLCTMLNMVRQRLGRLPMYVNQQPQEPMFNLPSETTQLQGDVWFKDLENDQ
ncbi:hypothetical protein BOX15_Mlig008053g1 [Macrostomum lignano]|uniref:ANK_REP_REGION domain-containing protein n=2 Tax=Macrostomum lignano TaxID=282301 RepID=A0A267H3C4_9PLAT|nr:hypothetical protein BOX15_Mlig008053g1 [Macrostomum lignano]